MARRAVLNNVAEMLQNAGRMLEDLNSTENSGSSSNAHVPVRSPLVIQGTTQVTPLSRMNTPSVAVNTESSSRRRPVVTGTPDRQSTIDVQTEVNNIFQPYAGPRRISSLPYRRESPSSSRRSASRSSERIWTQKLFCLSGPKDTRVPPAARKAYLQESGLGLGVVHLVHSASSLDVERALRLEFPKLGEASFELVHPVAGGRCQPLVRLSSNSPIPNVSYLSAALHRSATAYVRPMCELLKDEEQFSDDSNGFHEEHVTDMSSSDSQLHHELHQHLNHGRHGGEADNTENTNGMEDSHDTADYNSQGQMLTQDEEITIHDLRVRMYKENPGVQPVFVQRANFECQVLGVYKHPKFNLLMEPDVTFIGETGVDAGALQKEYFWTAMSSLSCGKFNNIPIFEGEENFRVPCSNGVLLRSGIYSNVGRFMTHAALHTGTAFIGLSRAISEYLLADEVGPDTPFNMGVQDVPDEEAREVIELLDNWQAGSLSEEDVDKVNTVASDAGLLFKLDVSNKQLLRDNIMYHYVIERRRATLDVIRGEIKKTPLFEFLSTRKYLHDSVFPKHEEVFVPPAVLITKIEVEGDKHSDVFERFKSFLIHTLGKDPHKSKEVLKAWTGWPLLPEGKLKLKIVPDAEFAVHACFSELILPADSTDEFISVNMEAMLKIGTMGFGSF